MAESKRTPASYLAESRNTTAGNPFMGKTLAEMKKMYSKMTPEQRGKNVETFRRAAAAAAKKPASKLKVTKKVASTSKPKPAAPKKDTPKKPQSKTGVYGKPLPSNPKLKSQPKPKPKKMLEVPV